MSDLLPDPFESVRFKLRWANEHLDKTRKLAERFLQSKFYRWAPQTYAKRRIDFRVTEVDPLPAPLALVMGDAAHNMRSALDYLMGMFANPTTKREQRHVSFPIVDARKDWKSVLYKMPGVPHDVRTVVESLQPYHRRSWPETMLLSQLREINDWDKHRRLSTAVTIAEWTNLHPVITKGSATIIAQYTFRRRLKPGAVFARLQLSLTGDECKVDVKPEFGLAPVFNDGMPKQVRMKQIFETLFGIHIFIEHDVLPRFARFV